MGGLSVITVITKIIRILGFDPDAFMTGVVHEVEKFSILPPGNVRRPL